MQGNTDDAYAQLVMLGGADEAERNIPQKDEKWRLRTGSKEYPYEYTKKRCYQQPD